MSTFLNDFWMILVESSLWLIIGFAIAGAVHAIIPRQWMLKHLSGGGFWPIAKAALLGIPLPLCSCSVIPVAAGLRAQGASKGASAAFAISTPQTGEESIPITWALFGPVYAITRPIVAVITGLIAGLLIDATGKKELERESTHDEIEIEDAGAMSLSIVNPDASSSVKAVESRNAAQPKSCCSAKSADPVTSVSSCCSSKPVAPVASCCSSKKTDQAPSSCCSTTPAPTLSPTHSTIADKFKSAFKFGFGTMLIDLAGWLTFGLILAAIISAALPQDWIATHIGSGILPKLIMLLVGIPLYICATSSTPLAFSLVVAGLSPGAALVLLLSGPATNVATMSWLIKDLGVRALVIYLGTIATVALLAGVLFDAYFTQYVHIAAQTLVHDHSSHGFGVKEIAAAVFILLMAWALGMKARKYMNKKGWGTTAPAAGGCCSSGAPSSPSPAKSSTTSCGCAR